MWRYSVITLMLFALFLSKAIGAQPQTFLGLKDTALVDAYNKASTDCMYENLALSLSYSQKAKSLADSLNYQRGLAYAIKGEGTVMYYSGEYLVADSLYQSAYTMFEHLNNQDELIKCLYNIGLVNIDLGNLDNAENKFKSIIQSSKKRGDIDMLCNVQLMLSNVYYWKGDLWKAIAQSKKALALGREHENVSLMLDACLNTGAFYSELGEPINAIKYLEEALQLSEDQENSYKKAKILANLSDVYYELESYNKANYLIDESIEIRERVGIISELPSAYRRKGRVEFALGNFEKSLTIFQRTLKLDQELEDTVRCAITYQLIAQSLTALDQLGSAEALLLQALEINQHFEVRLQEMYVLADLTVLEMKRGSFEKAVAYYERYSRLHQELNVEALSGLSIPDPILEHPEEYTALLKYTTKKVETQASWLIVGIIVAITLLSVALLLLLIILLRHKKPKKEINKHK